jgi:hypothetical protein
VGGAVVAVLVCAGEIKQNSKKQIVAKRRRIKISFRKDSRLIEPEY